MIVNIQWQVVTADKYSIVYSDVKDRSDESFKITCTTDGPLVPDIWSSLQITVKFKEAD